MYFIILSLNFLVGNFIQFCVIGSCVVRLTGGFFGVSQLLLLFFFFFFYFIFFFFFIFIFFFFKQKTAYEIVSRDWSSDVCSSDLAEFEFYFGNFFWKTWRK